MTKEEWFSYWAQEGQHNSSTQSSVCTERVWDIVSPKREDTILYPLCGKGVLLDWLMERHSNVTAIELSDIPVKSFFSQRFYLPTVTQIDSYTTLYQFDELSLYVGDIFHVPLSRYDVVYEQDGFDSLDESEWPLYAQKLESLVAESGKLCIVFGKERAFSPVRGNVFFGHLNRTEIRINDTQELVWIITLD
ncbi:thiopurine S-methyltransferase [Vibrio sp.]|uniref:Thiopurine S-methyltransferase n=1 Tax=Vibrio viridaestus TaxID=2487322 RepID=A0A3N9TER7_9VIBR|nr:thiopurine S-methyltransferase [Vibrio viridaestus]MDC0612240.1 thiopurine S-methyltransferase [Vibrio sp.]RQW61935.1 thiopurine S-methyltransferase [Vibrio viridaestus]